MKKNTLEIVNKVLVVADLMELIEITGNVEEYMVETKHIAEYLEKYEPSVKRLARYIREIFVEYFDECFDMEKCSLVADCILRNLESEE
jgi:hypothetical protein